jgi:hypothetical protein
MSGATNARAVALKILLAHFPNLPFVMRGIERSYEPAVARDLPSAMLELRERLEGELLRALASNAADSAYTTKV